MSVILQNYLNKQLNNQALITNAPEKDLQLVIIIPAYNEPNLLKTLRSLKDCTPAKFPTEVLILINNADNALSAIVDQNKKTYTEVAHWINDESTTHLKFHCILKGDFPSKHAGVGLARKTLMDEACRRFAYHNNDLGIIASFDADSIVSTNYITNIQNIFESNKKLICATFFFEHQISDDLNSSNRKAIILYEIYLHYFKLALQYTGFPYAFHTVGSCFAVKALSYAKQGGMSRRQAGEDFYFLHKIFPLGNCIEANHIKVHPSSRPSDRVPFGTGNAIQKIMNDGNFLSYDPVYFKHLKGLFEAVIKLFKQEGEVISNLYTALDSSLKNFIPEIEFTTKLTELNNHSASKESFIHRFYLWFDAFKIIKYLNFVHTTQARLPISEAAYKFLDLIQRNPNSDNPLILLNTLKKIELE